MKNINILNNLNSGKISSYFTTNGTKEFTCENNGYVDNVVIEGETLVNLMPFVVKEINSGGDYFIIFPDNQQGLSYNRVSNGIYTLFNLSQKNVAFEVADIGGYSNYSIHHVDANSCKVVSISNTQRLYSCVGSVAQFETLDKFIQDCRVVILEGNHTDKPISYFEGLKSVGQGDKIEVLTHPTNISHKVDLPNIVWKDNYYLQNDLTGNTGIEIPYKGASYSETYIPIEGNTEYLFINFNWNFCFYDENKQFIPTVCEYPMFETADKKAGYFIKKSPVNAKYVRVVVDINYKSSIEIYKHSKYDKKQISTTLRSLPNGVRDTIEKRGNKYVKVQRCGEVILDGTEDNWYTTNSAHAETLRFSKPHSNLSFKEKELQCASDRFVSAPNNEWNFNREQVDQDGGNLNIVISRSRLSTHNENGLRAYLKENPLTVVYELATPIITELPNFNPQTYKGDNTLLINGGVIQCEANFTVNEGIRSELNEVKDKVSNLTESIKNSLGSEMSNEINTIKNTVNNNKNEINTIKNTVSTNTNEINTIKNTVSTVQKTKMTHDDGSCINITGGNANDISITGFFMGSNVANVPSVPNSWVYIESLVHNNLYQVQTATELHNSSNRWTRHKTGGNWSEWRSL